MPEVLEEEGEAAASRDFTGTGSTGEVGSTRSVPLAAPMSLSELLPFNCGATLGSTRSNILASASHPSPATPGPVGREGDLSVTWARRGALAPENDTLMHKRVIIYKCVSAMEYPILCTDPSILYSDTFRGFVSISHKFLYIVRSRKVSKALYRHLDFISEALWNSAGVTTSRLSKRQTHFKAIWTFKNPLSRDLTIRRLIK